MADEEFVGLGLGQLEAEGAEDEAEFFVGEEAVFVGVEEVELGRGLATWGKGEGEEGRSVRLPRRGFFGRRRAC